MKSKVIQIIFLNIIIALFLLPLYAEEGEEIEEANERGEFFIDVEDWFVKPANADYQIATIIPSAPFIKQSSVISIPFTTESSFKFRMGWKFKDNLGSIALVYWGFSNKNQIVRTDPGNFVFTENLTFPLFAGVYDDGLADGVRGDFNIRATSLSFLFIREFSQMKRVHAEWRLGIRKIGFKQKSFVEYYALVPTLIDPFPPEQFIPQNDHIREQSDFQAKGIEVGTTLDFRIAKRVSFGGGVGISFLLGDSEANYASTNYLYMDSDGYYYRPQDASFSDNDIQLSSTVMATANESDSIIQIIDADLNVKWNIWRGLDFTVGYAVSYWSGVLLREQVMLAETSFLFYSQFAKPTRQDIAFQGAYLRLGYRY